MKGAFRQACERAELAGELQYGTCKDYCGDESDITPGMLRFEGAYPINNWTQGLVDMVHPQQKWQVKTYETNDKRATRESAYALVSLNQPTLRFGISSIKPLSSEQWQEVWRIWGKSDRNWTGDASLCRLRTI
jgi:CRISPR-associated protein Cmr6